MFHKLCLLQLFIGDLSLHWGWITFYFSGPSIFFFSLHLFMYLFLKLEANCFIMFCCLLPYNDENQPYVYIYPFQLLVLWKIHLMQSLLHFTEASIYHFISPVEKQKHQAGAGSQPGQRKTRLIMKPWAPSWTTQTALFQKAMSKTSKRQKRKGLGLLLGTLYIDKWLVFLNTVNHFTDRHTLRRLDLLPLVTLPSENMVLFPKHIDLVKREDHPFLNTFIPPPTPFKIYVCWRKSEKFKSIYNLPPLLIH